MNIKEIESLIKTMTQSKVSHLTYENNGVKLEIHQDSVATTVEEGSSTNVKQHKEVKLESQINNSLKNNNEITTDSYESIRSPLVGVFYEAPSPSEPAFVKVGDFVEKGQVLCIVEAMKVMNEIVAKESGTIKEVLVGNGDIVEYDQPLFKIGL